MTAPLTLDQIEDAEEFELALERWRRTGEPPLDDVGSSEHQRSVALVRLAFADLRIRSAADDLLAALKDLLGIAETEGVVGDDTTLPAARAATAISDALERGGAPTSAEQGVEAMSPEEIARAASGRHTYISRAGPTFKRLLSIASDHAAQADRIARLKAENAALVAEITETRRRAVGLSEHAGAHLCRAEAAEAALVDLGTHYRAWREGLIQTRDDAAEKDNGGDIDDAGYWNHEIAVLDRVVAALQPAARPAGDETGGDRGN